MELPAEILESFEALAVPGERIEFSAPAGGDWILLSPLALYVGPDRLERWPRGWITGLEFERGLRGRGTVQFVGRDGILGRVEYAPLQRRALVELESRLATGEAAPPAPIVASRAPRRRKGITIVLDQPDFAPGERVRGVVVVDWPVAAPVRGIHVTLIGAEETAITVRKGSGKHSRSVTYREHNPICGLRSRLFGSETVGFFRGVQEGVSALVGAKRFPTLKAGRHEYAFDFPLPLRALPTHHGTYATVRYTLTAHVDVPLAFDLVSEGEIPVVAPRGTVLHAATDTRDFTADGVLKGFKANMRLTADVESAPLKPGAPLEGVLHVLNGSHKKVKRARFSLHRLERARAGGYVRDADVELLNGTLSVPNPSAPRFDAVFGMVLPSSACAYQGRHSEVALALDLTLDVAWAFDVGLRVGLASGRLAPAHRTL